MINGLKGLVLLFFPSAEALFWKFLTATLPGECQRLFSQASGIQKDLFFKCKLKISST